MKSREHVGGQINAVMKIPGVSILNLSLRNLCLLGCIFGLITGLICSNYLQSIVNTSSRSVVQKNLKRDERPTTPQPEGQPLSLGRTIDKVSAQTHEGKTLVSERTGGESFEVGDEEGTTGMADDWHKKLDEGRTPKPADAEKEEEAEAAVTPNSSDDNVIDSYSVNNATEEEYIETLRFSQATALDSDERHSSSMPEGGELGNHRRKSPDVIEANHLEDAPLAPDQIRIDSDQEESTIPDSQTILLMQEKRSDEDGSLHLLSLDPSQTGANSSKNGGVVSNSMHRDQCDIFKGNWTFDPLGPLYSSSSCGVLSQAQNCQDNGRPDKLYEFYRWQPQDCDLPRLDPLAFLEFMKGKTLAFIGDSVARNQYESLMCILLQVAKPKNRGNKNLHRWFFPTHRFTLVRMWSGWLVRQTTEPFSYAPEDSVKLFLDELDEFADKLPSFDVAVISSGHWWMRKTAYILGGKIRGGYGWNANTNSKKVDQSQAFGIAMKNVLNKIREIPNYKGLTILRTYSPDHYEGGRWDTGGSCTGKTEPYGRNELPRNNFNEMMRQKQMDAIKLAMQKGSESRNGSTLALLDVFEALNFRADGHPGPYRNRDPNKRTQRDGKGHPPPQDCLHWCMPGPVDTMNQLLFEVLQQQFQKR